MKAMDQKPRDKAGVHLERRPSHGASKVLDKQIEGLGQKRRGRWCLTLKEVLKTVMAMICFVSALFASLWASRVLCRWAKKEVSDEPITVPSEAGLERFEFDGNFEQMKRSGTLVETFVTPERLDGAIQQHAWG